MNPQQFNPNNRYDPNSFQSQPAGQQPDKTKILYAGIGTLLVVSLLLAFFALINRGGLDRYFIQAIGYQREILRINELAEDHADSSDFNNYRSNVNALVTSDLTSLQTSYGKEVKAKQTASIADDQVIVRFEDAAQTNSFEQEYSKTMSATLNKSIKSLTGLKTEASSKHSEVINTALQNQKALLEQLDDL